MPFTLHRAAASTKAKRIGSLVTPMAASKGRRGGLIDLTVDGLETIDLTKDYPSDLSQLSDFDGLTNNVSFYDQPHAPSPPSPATLQLDLTSLHVVDEVVKLEPTQALAASRLAWIMSTNEETIKHILATHKPQDWDQLGTSLQRPPYRRHDRTNIQCQRPRAHQPTTSFTSSAMRFKNPTAWALLVWCRTTKSSPTFPLSRSATGRGRRALERAVRQSSPLCPLRRPVSRLFHLV